MSRLLVKDCVFVNNSARGFGGAVAVKGRDVTFEGCLFRNNSGGAGGGGVAIGGGPRQEDRASVTFTRCCWGNNTAVMGGAFHVTEGRVQIVDSSVEGNHAVRLGGAGFVAGGLVSLCARALFATKRTFSLRVCTWNQTRGLTRSTWWTL